MLKEGNSRGYLTEISANNPGKLALKAPCDEKCNFLPTNLNSIQTKYSSFTAVRMQLFFCRWTLYVPNKIIWKGFIPGIWGFEIVMLNKSSMQVHLALKTGVILSNTPASELAGCSSISTHPHAWWYLYQLNRSSVSVGCSSVRCRHYNCLVRFTNALWFGLKSQCICT